MTISRRQLLWTAAALAARAETPQVPASHPRVLITPELVKEMARKATGEFAAEYQTLLATARMGPDGLDRAFGMPAAFMEAGLAFLIERELGRDGTPYAAKVLDIWRQPQWQKPGLARHFGWQGLLYDWLYDAMSEAERGQFGELLAEWVATWWKSPHVNIERDGWWYNQHWGPAHLDTPNHRVALLAKLMIDLAVKGHGGRFEDALTTNLEEFFAGFRDVGLPALDVMGGIWSESNGHGGYGPTLTVPLGYQAVQAATSFDPFARSAPLGFAREYIQACIYSLMPHNTKLAYIDDSSSGRPLQHARASPLFARHFRDGVARWLSDKALAEGWLRHPKLQQDEVWQRLAWLPADVKPVSPKQAGWPLAYHFSGAGHVYMLSAWDDPNATWAFFGAGPSYAGHSRDDEGHFLITKRGHVVNRSGGQGHNDNCYYSGGSLVFNIVTVYHPREPMIRTTHNENDGGIVRHVYERVFPWARGRITAYWHDPGVATYAAADLTQAYWPGKVREVTRQFLYLRGSRECFVIFDRVESTRPDLPKHWMLHLPSEPAATDDYVTWLSDPAGDTDLISTGRTRVTMQTVFPRGARITRRGGPGQDFWGHPDNPAAQYNHTLDITGKENPAYRRPPYSPWRLEVQPPSAQLRDYFLHALSLTQEGETQQVRAQRIEEKDRLGARLQLGDRAVAVWFHTTGPIGGHLSVRRAAEALHDAPLPLTL